MRSIYIKIRSILPESLHGYLTYLLYLTGLKPTVNKHVKSPFTKGVVVLSADFEMSGHSGIPKSK